MFFNPDEDVLKTIKAWIQICPLLSSIISTFSPGLQNNTISKYISDNFSDMVEVYSSVSLFFNPRDNIQGKHFVFIIFWFILDFFSIITDFLLSQNFANSSPDQPPYNFTWHIRFSERKLNIFCRWHFMISHFKKGCFIYWDQMNTICTSKKGHIKFTHISNKTIKAKST